MKKIPVESIHKELDLVQNVILRMANNSFIVKGWTITLNTAIFLLLKEDVLSDRIYFVSIPMVIGIVLFWRIDAFFLHVEKGYRHLYNHKLSEDRDYKDLYSLNYMPFISNKDSILRMMVNQTIWPFYAVPIFLVVAITIYQVLAK